MQRNEALAFLEQHQPLPDQPDDATLDRYKAVLLHFYDNPDARCLPLILGSACLFEDMTLYDSMYAVLNRYADDLIIPHIATACDSPYTSVRFAAADVAMQYPHPSLIEPLAVLLTEGAALIRLAAASALEQIGGHEVKELAKIAIITEKDEDILEILETILGR